MVQVDVPRLVEEAVGRGGRWTLLLVTMLVGLAVGLACAPAATPTPTATATRAAATPTPTATSQAIATATPTPTRASPSPTPTRPKQAGTLVVAVSGIGTSPSGLPRDCPQCEFLTNASVQDVLLRSAWNESHDLVVEPALAESWTLAPDGSYTDFKIRKGVQFHNGWGELTAEDVAWTYNEVIAPESVHATKSEALDALKPGSKVEVVSPDTVRFYWNAFAIPTYHKTVTGWREGIGVFSKRVFNEKGEQWMRENVIGTGPFRLIQWTPGDRMALEAVENHFLQTPYVKQAIYVDVPEPATARAMLETGEAQIAGVPVKDWPALVEQGFKLAPEGAINDMGIIMGGNYWEKTHPTSGATLQRPDYTNLPWVGDPDDPASMERAKKVRWALSMTINREAINQAVLGGLGRVSLMGGIDDRDPIFKRVAGTIPYDPAQAKQLLVEAGYPNGFDMEFYADEAGSTNDEIARVLAAEWGAKLGVRVKITNLPYSVYRPNFINRTVFTLNFRTGGAFAPSTWQEEWYISAIVSNTDGSQGGGFNSGMEIPVASQTLLKKRAAKTDAEVVAASEEYLRYIFDQQLWPGTVEWETAALYNPKMVCDWRQLPMATGSMAGARNLETARLC